MQIYVKIGTMPAQYYHLFRRRKTPSVGDHIQVKKENKSYIKPESILIDGLKRIHGETLFLAARM